MMRFGMNAPCVTAGMWRCGHSAPGAFAGQTFDPVSIEQSANASRKESWRSGLYLFRTSLRRTMAVTLTWPHSTACLSASSSSASSSRPTDVTCSSPNWPNSVEGLSYSNVAPPNGFS